MGRTPEVVFVIVAASVLLACCGTAQAKTIRPVLIVPGFIGSSLMWEDPSSKGDPKHGIDPGFKHCWINLSMLFTELSMWVDGMSLRYDPTTNNFVNGSKNVKPVGYGDVTGVWALDGGIADLVADYLQNFITAMEGVGYTRGVNVRAATFEWRLCPGWDSAPQSVEWRAKTTALVEEMYEASNGTKVVVWAHSFGGNTATYWLAGMSAEWKSKYVDTYVVVAAPFGGAVKALLSLVSGWDFGIGIWGVSPINYRAFRDVSRTWPSVVAMLPNQETGKPLIIAGSKQYYLKDMFNVIAAAGSNLTALMTEAYPGSGPLPHVGVPVYCQIGVGKGTTTQLVYKSDGDWDSIPKTLNADGDGTVLADSARRCKEWANDGYPFTYTEAWHIDHIGIVRKAQFFTQIIQDVFIRD